MSRKRLGVEIWVTAGLLALMVSGCATGVEPVEPPRTTLTFMHPKAQGWTNAKVCAETVCVTTEARGRTDETTPGRLAFMEIEVAGGPLARWDGEALAELDDPVLHKLVIRTTWTAGMPSAADIVEVVVPFGFMRKRTECQDTDEEVLDAAVFDIRMDGTMQFDVERLGCQEDAG